MARSKWAMMIVASVVLAAAVVSTGGCGTVPGPAPTPAPDIPRPAPADPAPSAAALEPALVLDYTVFDEETYDAPVKTQVTLKVLVPANASRADLQALLETLYSSIAARRGYDYHDAPTSVWIYAYTSREFAESGLRHWIAMLAKAHVDPGPTVSFNEAQFAQRTAIPETKFGLSEEERKALFKEIVRVEDATEGRATDDGKNRLARQHGVTRQQLDEIGVEGVLKDWPFPPR